MFKAKNVVLNISEMESKVREATNDEPWCGFRSSLWRPSKSKRNLAGEQVPV